MLSRLQGKVDVYRELILIARNHGLRLAVVCLAILSLQPLASSAAADDREVSVGAIAQAVGWNFQNDIIPVLSRFGCNTSGCHGKAEGQNGFKLSVFGFDLEADYAAIVQEGRGRRVFPAAAERSLLLLKSTGEVPHGGGARISRNRPEYARLRDWISAGMPFGSSSDPQISKIQVEPAERQMEMLQVQQLSVTATWSDGRKEDVTQLATFQTNYESLAMVDENGLVTAGANPGVVAVMATYLGQVDIFQAIIPRIEQLDAAAREQLNQNIASDNVIDRQVAAWLLKLNLAPSGPCDEPTFLRRVYVDTIGTLPTGTEARQYLSETSDNRRTELVDQLLERPEFTDYWTMKWADLLRVNRRTLGRKGAQAYYQWIHENIGQNKSLDQFAAELLTAEGPLEESPAAYFYKVVPDPNEMANTVSQVFLGVRIECARCHHHPWDRWSQTDYHGMQAFFTQAVFKPNEGSESLTNSGVTLTTHPRTNETIFAHPLGQPVPQESPVGNRRELLAKWLASPENPFFARNLANRAWAHFLGRGLVEPVDDFRMTNPPSNPELLDALAQYLGDNHFDFKQLVRTIVLSQTYQRSVVPNETNATDAQNYSRFPMKRLEAEVLYDAVCQTTGVQGKFAGVTDGQRAIQLWDSHVPHYFLEVFGRPVRATACQCERVCEPTVGQVLHVLNSSDIHDKLRHVDGRIASLCLENIDNQRLIEEIYLSCFSRFPTEEERAATGEHLRITSVRNEAAEDIAWSLINSLEFLFNH